MLKHWHLHLTVVAAAAIPSAAADTVVVAGTAPAVVDGSAVATAFVAAAAVAASAAVVGVVGVVDIAIHPQCCAAHAAPPCAPCHSDHASLLQVHEAVHGEL